MKILLFLFDFVIAVILDVFEMIAFVLAFLFGD